MANGASFLVGSSTFSVNATKEVILSAGTVQTPQLLELSGEPEWVERKSRYHPKVLFRNWKPHSFEVIWNNPFN